MKVSIEANWDDQAAVWVAVARDDVGIVTEAATIEELQRKLAVLIPDLLGGEDSQFESANVILKKAGLPKAF